MLTHFVKIQYCYDYLINQIPVGLLLYSHIPTAIIAIIFGGYLIYKNRNISSIALFIVCISFAVWCFLDLSSWFAFLGTGLTMFTWSLVDLVGLFFFFFSYYFLYSFITGKDLPLWQKLSGIALMAPTFVWTFLGSNLKSFDGTACQANENSFVTNYLFGVEIFFVLAVIVLTIYQYRKTQEKTAKRETLLAGFGVTIFLFFFFFSTFITSLLVDNNIWANAYNVEIYGLFGMPLLLGFLGYLVVKYKAFDLKVFGAQALILTLIALIGSQFFFVQTLSTRILTAITLIITGFIGINLMRSVKKEVELRESLQIANAGQSNLIHIMNHQIKGYLSKSRNIFAELLSENGYGVNDESRPMIKEGFESLTEGVGFVQQVLNGSSAESGTLVYAMNKFDMKDLVQTVTDGQKESADKKGLSYEIKIDEGDYKMTGDNVQLRECVRNLIDNSIRYTLKGGLKIHLARTDSKIVFSVTDTGVGIAPEDKPKLFTKGGRGKDSLRLNVNSTGYGLAFVKGVVEAHKGRVWVDSKGVGFGSTFYMELPVVI